MVKIESECEIKQEEEIKKEILPEGERDGELS